MAGIFDRVKPGDGRVAVHLLKAAIFLGTDGVFTDQQILDQLNAKLEADGVPTLDAASVSDLAAVRTSISNAAENCSGKPSGARAWTISASPSSASPAIAATRRRISIPTRRVKCGGGGSDHFPA